MTPPLPKGESHREHFNAAEVPSVELNNPSRCSSRVRHISVCSRLHTVACTGSHARPTHKRVSIAHGLWHAGPTMKFGQLVVRYSAEHGIIAARGSTLIANYRGPIGRPIMDAAEAVQRQILNEHGNRCFMLTVVESGLPLPDDGARSTITAHFKRMSAQNVAVATVILGDGFWAGAARSIMSGLTLVARPPCPSTVAPDVPTAARFLQSHGRQEVDVFGLVTDVESMRGAAASAPFAVPLFSGSSIR